MNNIHSIILKGATFALALTTVACASAPDRPDRQMARAESSIEVAQETGAQQYGPAALERAQKQLDQAEVAAANQEYELALRLAERAELDARLAVSQTNHLKAAAALEELQQSIDSLRREIARNQAS